MSTAMSSAASPSVRTPGAVVRRGCRPGDGMASCAFRQGRAYWSGGPAELNVADAGGGEAQAAAGGVGEAAQHVQGRQAATAFDAGDRGLRGAHAPGQLGLGQARPGARGIDQLGQADRAYGKKKVFGSIP